MTSLIDDVKELQQRMEALDKGKPADLPPPPKPPKKKRRFRFRIPFGFRKGLAKNKVLVCFLRANKQVMIKEGCIDDGRLIIDDQQYAYESSTVYQYRKFPFIVILEWRLLPVGGRAEEYAFRRVGGDEDAALAEELGINNFGQMTIIRGIEASKVEGLKKKTGGISMILWLLLGVGALYLIAKIFGWA